MSASTESTSGSRQCTCRTRHFEPGRLAAGAVSSLFRGGSPANRKLEVSTDENRATHSLSYYCERYSRTRTDIPFLRNRFWVKRQRLPGRGRIDRGRGFNKGAITVAEGSTGRSGCHPLRLFTMDYVPREYCHGRGRGFEPRRPRHKPKKTQGLWHSGKIKNPL